MNKEEELVKDLKDSFPDMLDFNNRLKELRKFWKGQGRQEQKKEVLNVIDKKMSDWEDDKIWSLTDLIFQIKQKIKGEKLK